NVFTQDFMIGAGDQALVGNGTNLTALLITIAPECTNDILGNYRGSVWDIGAYQHPTTNLTGGNGVYVATNSNASDSFKIVQAGNAAKPWRTIQKSLNTATNGMTVLVGPGVYNERDVTTSANGSAGTPITFMGLPANDPFFPVDLHNFRVKH